MLDSLISPQQQQVIDAVSDGASSTDAAAQAGVHTIANWRRNSLFFREALADAQLNMTARLKAAMFIIGNACTPPQKLRPGRNIGSPPTNCASRAQ
jgi:hypothetical protein